MKSTSGVAIIERAERFSGRIAVVDPTGEYTYGQLLENTERAAVALLRGRKDLEEAPVCFLTPAGFDYVWTQWAIWRAGGMAVPLCDRHPLPELEHVIADCGAQRMVVHPSLADRLLPLCRKFDLEILLTTDLLKTGSGPTPVLPEISRDGSAMILYTSGSTGKPRGVVTTHANIEAQVECLAEAWQWRQNDRILNVLPLHHVHGIINVLCCALWSGATCEFQPKFDAGTVWKRFKKGGLTLFMAVPTIYHRLIEYGEDDDASIDDQKLMSAACRDFRLMVSGSAALPVPVFEKWRRISGQTLLERYGMTEIGMALSNPLEGERRPGFVGHPLPGVQVRLTDENGEEVAEGQPGQIEVRGASVFLEYWNLPEATEKAFRKGWFLTGDIAQREDGGGAFRILGRSSIDIIKTGGYKVSALEIENILLEHPAIREAAVVGVEDNRWGEQVCAAIVLHRDARLSGDDLRHWAKTRLARYKAPARVRMVQSFPRNSMGKVLKTDLQNLFSVHAES